MSDSLDSGDEQARDGESFEGGPVEPGPEDAVESGREGEELGPDLPTTPGEADVDPALRTMFWKLVLLYKVTIIGITLGVLLVVFDKGPGVGPELLAGGVALLVYTLYVTKRGKERVEAGEFHDEDEDAGENDAVDAGNAPAGPTPQDEP